MKLNYSLSDSWERGQQGAGQVHAWNV